MTTRIKVTSIENYWFSSIIQQMFFQTQVSERDRQNRYKLMDFEQNAKSEDVQKFHSAFRNNCSDLRIENFFSISTASQQQKEMLEEIFLNDIRFLSINQNNDTIVLSSQFLINEKNFSIIFKSLSGDMAFSNYCKYFILYYSFSVTYNPNLKNNNFNFELPEWLNKLEFYSIGQFILASIEQVIGVR